MLSIPFTQKVHSYEFDDVPLAIKKEYECMAKVIHDEANGETYKGKLAVAAVVMNRVNHKDFPDTVCDVVKQKVKGVCQFSGMCKPKARNIDVVSKEIAYNIVINEKMNDPTKGATHFHNDTVTPKWSETYARTIRIGNHTFYKQKR